MNQVSSNVMFLVVAVIFAYGLYHTVGLALDTEVPVVAVTSGSMEPAMERGDMIVVQGVPFEELAVDDVIVYQTEDMPVPIIHRVIEKNATALQTKGDKNAFQHSFEKYVAPEAVLGRSSFTIPYIGYFKLIPTCTYLHAQYGDAPRIQYLCPPGEL